MSLYNAIAKVSWAKHTLIMIVWNRQSFRMFRVDLVDERWRGKLLVSVSHDSALRFPIPRMDPNVSLEGKRIHDARRNIHANLQLNKQCAS